MNTPVPARTTARAAHPLAVAPGRTAARAGVLLVALGAPLLLSLPAAHAVGPLPVPAALPTPVAAVVDAVAPLVDPVVSPVVDAAPAPVQEAVAPVLPPSPQPEPAPTAGGSATPRPGTQVPAGDEAPRRPAGGSPASAGANPGTTTSTGTTAGTGTTADSGASAGPARGTAASATPRPTGPSPLPAAGGTGVAAVAASRLDGGLTVVGTGIATAPLTAGVPAPEQTATGALPLAAPLVVSPAASRLPVGPARPTDLPAALVVFAAVTLAAVATGQATEVVARRRATLAR